jgi:hypothetical protein
MQDFFLTTYYKYLKRIWSVPSEGFGDTFAKITKTFGIKPCFKCTQRQKDWNEKLKYAKLNRHFDSQNKL